MTKIMDLEIRDTNTYDSDIVNNTEAQWGYGITAKATIYYDNDHNQPVTLQVMGSPDNQKWFKVGSAISVSAQGTTGEEDYATLTEFHQFLKVQAKCSVAPTSGKIRVWLEGL